MTDLIMPDKHQSITVKIIGPPYISGDDAYCDVKLFGIPRNETFKMKIGKTLWVSLYEQLENRFVFGGDSDEELDDNLEILSGMIITIEGEPDLSRSYWNSKENRPDSPKIFEVTLREDLVDAEIAGGDIYNQVVDKEVRRNKKSFECLKVNMAQIYDREIKKLEREIKKEKRHEVAKQTGQNTLEKALNL